MVAANDCLWTIEKGVPADERDQVKGKGKGRKKGSKRKNKKEESKRD